MSINAGYMGLINFGGKKIRFTDCSVAPKQEVIAPDLVMGDWDHDSFYYGPITIEGSVSGPIDNDFGSAIWDKAWKRPTCGQLTEATMNVSYYCSSGGGTPSVSIPKVLINSLTISATAGDIANFSFDVMGSGATGTTSAGTLTDNRKILTWDALSFTATGGGGVTIPSTEINAFEFTVSNNVTPAYILGDTVNGLYPSQLVTGIRTITGSLTVYNNGGSGWPTKWNNDVSTGTITIAATGAGLSISCKVLFHRIQPQGQVGPVTSTIAFTGVSHQAG